MKLTINERVDLLGTAKALNPILGDLFQNPMEITTDDLWKEVEAAWDAKRAENERYQSYIDKLGMLLCFPQQP